MKNCWNDTGSSSWVSIPNLHNSGTTLVQTFFFSVLFNDDRSTNCVSKLLFKFHRLPCGTHSRIRLLVLTRPSRKDGSQYTNPPRRPIFSLSRSLTAVNSRSSLLLSFLFLVMGGGEEVSNTNESDGKESGQPTRVPVQKKKS